MRVLACDLATVTGFAIDGPNGQPESGRYRLVGSTRGLAFLGFNRWLYDMAADADMIVYEAPLMGGAVMKEDTVIKLVGLAAQAEMIGAARGIRVEKAAISTVRKFFCGTGRPKNPKRAVMDRCRTLGLRPVDDNAADALALWHFAKSKHDQSFRMGDMLA